VTFSDNADFSGATFGGFANFYSASFSGEARFESELGCSIRGSKHPVT
jgi:hypothetical protein